MNDNPPSFEPIVVVGAGAVGSYFGALLAESGRRVTLIGRPAHVQAIRSSGLRVERRDGVRTVRLDASSELDAVRDAALVLVCVKSPDTAALARQLAPLLAPGALVMSLQNGVDNAEVLAAELKQPVLPTAVYVATAMPAPGVVQHFGRGDLVIGTLPGSSGDAAPRLPAVAALFEAAGVPVKVSADVLAELWDKLALNCAYNAVSALAQLPYGRIVELPAMVDVMRDALHEVVAVAAAAGHPIDAGAALLAFDRLAQVMPAQMSSTAQDLARGKPSEIDQLNGHVVRRGAELGVPTPVNRTLHALVKLVESSRAVGKASAG